MVGRAVIFIGGLVHKVGRTLGGVGRTVGNGGRTGGLVQSVGLIFGLVGSSLVGTRDQIKNFRVVRPAVGLVGMTVGLWVAGGFGIGLVGFLVMGSLLVGLRGGIFGLLVGCAMGGRLGGGGVNLGGGGLGTGLGGAGTLRGLSFGIGRTAGALGGE
ncbi:hypothetical protein M5D96_008537 [Drosophila gunungcola]|uniref:Uncharacterized protein n=1 Tax=Drosophila gunungcola TaxID=103775 RepID=A0A9Q0BP45_9MUSC|nr:hypothetical protein M5D96_008537 [Drosophila gunungcola]